MVMITFLKFKLTEEIFLFRTGGGGGGGYVHMVLPQCCSQQEKIVDKTQKIT